MSTPRGFCKRASTLSRLRWAPMVVSGYPGWRSASIMASSFHFGLETVTKVIPAFQERRGCPTTFNSALFALIPPLVTCMLMSWDMAVHLLYHAPRPTTHTDGWWSRGTPVPCATPRLTDRKCPREQREMVDLRPHSTTLGTP